MPPLPAGVEAPPFRLPDLAGREVALGDFLALGPVWLVFYKRSCPTCALAVPYLQRLMDLPDELEGSVVLVAQDEPDDARAFVTAHGLSLSVLVESAPWPVGQAYGLSSVPTSFLIESSGVIALSAEGFVKTEWEALARNLAARSGHPEFELFSAADAVPAFKPG